MINGVNADAALASPFGGCYTALMTRIMNEKYPGYEAVFIAIDIRRSEG